MVYALVFGMLLPVTIRMNEVLGRTVGLVPSSVAVHVTGGIFGILCMLPFVDRGWVGAVGRAPWWAWMGGVLGAGLVVLANRAVGMMGVAGFMAVNVSVQLIVGGLLDHYGLLHSPVHAMSLARAGGIVLLAAGAVLVVRG